MYCPECGSTLDENAVFCGECGTKLGAGDQPSAPPSPAPSPSPVTPGPSGTPGAPKKKFPIWLIIVLAVVGVLVIGIISVFALKSFIGNKQETPEETTVLAYDEVEDVMDDFFGEETGTLLSESDTTAENTDQVPTAARTKVMTTQKIIATRAPETKPEATRAPSTVAPPSTTRPPVTQAPSDTTPTQPVIDDDWWDGDDWWYDDDYYPPVYGYTLDELEEAMDDFIYTGRWSDLSEYILPGSDEILDLMYSIEDSEGYANYAYQGGYEYINEYYFNFDEIPSAYSTDYYYHSLDAEDEEYRDNTMWGLYEMTEYAFDEYYGGNMEYYDLILMETCAYDDDYNDNGFFVFIIETDYGYFFLCE